MSWVAQCRCELPQEMERIVCCPSGGAEAGHFELLDEAAILHLGGGTVGREQ